MARGGVQSPCCGGECSAIGPGPGSLKAHLRSREELRFAYGEGKTVYCYACGQPVAEESWPAAALSSPPPTEENNRP